MTAALAPVGEVVSKERSANSPIIHQHKSTPLHKTGVSNYDIFKWRFIGLVCMYMGR